jgi:hypothetical protein
MLKIFRVQSKVAIAGMHLTTGLAERTVRTVEQILKAHIGTYKGSWHKILPFIAFNLRQVPCSLLPFSAHQLVFGENLNGGLSDLVDEFLGAEQPSDDVKVRSDVGKYLADLRERLELTRKIADEHAEKVQTRNKEYYDKKATIGKEFEVNCRVLVLEPSDTRKLFATWIGPGIVKKKVGDRSYLVQFDSGKANIYHVNQLRKFKERTEFINTVVIEEDRELNSEDCYLPGIDDDDVGEELCFNIEQSLPDDKQMRLREVLADYSDLFRPSLGRTTVVTHDIKLTDDRPFALAQYRIAEKLKEPFEREINRLITEGVLEETESAWRSPVIPILKSNKTDVRIVNDYKLLNERTVDDIYPMITPFEVLQKAAGKKFISKLDMNKAFNQIPLTENSKQFTSFSCYLGTFCWNTMPAGLKNSPRTMARCMDKVLKGTSKFCSCLCDDITIFSNSFEEHLCHLREIFFRLEEAGLTVSISKSEFCMKRMTVLGHCLENGTISPSDSHIADVMRIGPQKTKSGVRALLGLLGYHRKMIANYADITLCLNQLLKKGQPDRVCWEQCHTDALNKIKSVLSSKPVLVAPRFDREFIIMSDASNVCVSGILAQADDSGVERNIAYFSRKMKPNEINFSVIEKEGLAILECCLKWAQIIYGYPVKVRTDHRALEFLESVAKHNARIARWRVILSSFDLKTEYRRGLENGNADALTRIEYE